MVSRRTSICWHLHEGLSGSYHRLLESQRSDLSLDDFQHVSVQALGNVEYLLAAQRAANFSEVNGVILKGNHIGHGVGGNAYLVMSLYASTRDEIWLRKGQ